jgi:hypothetical protein
VAAKQARACSLEHAATFGITALGFEPWRSPFRIYGFGSDTNNLVLMLDLDCRATVAFGRLRIGSAALKFGLAGAKHARACSPLRTTSKDPDAESDQAMRRAFGGCLGDKRR